MCCVIPEKFGIHFFFFPPALLQRNGHRMYIHNLVDSLSVGCEGAARLEPLSAHVAHEGPLPGVLPLVEHKRTHVLYHFTTKAALKLRLLVRNFMAYHFGK